mmetsp:Transcript_108580/g.317697  ORF Transcript_108580/g.317697 Transcript_108580/m.317697 type:complete len:165 (-) Transcript_108580:397-891(-)
MLGAEPERYYHRTGREDGDATGSLVRGSCSQEAAATDHDSTSTAHAATRRELQQQAWWQCGTWPSAERRAARPKVWQLPAASKLRWAAQAINGRLPVRPPAADPVRQRAGAQTTTGRPPTASWQRCSTPAIPQQPSTGRERRCTPEGAIQQSAAACSRPSGSWR